MERSKLRLSILGPPGAGKGTQAKWIAGALGLEHVSTGDVLRKAIREGTPVGREAEAYVTSGKLVPDEIVSAVVGEFLGRRGNGKGYILDGFPRTVSQAERLAGMAAAGSPAVDRAIHISLPDATAVERIAGRRVCGRCGREYHVQFRPPKQAGVCDADGAALVQRSDDREEAIRERLEAYHRQVGPLLDYYRERSVLAEVDGEGDAETVFERIRGILAATAARRSPGPGAGSGQ